MACSLTRWLSLLASYPFHHAVRFQNLPQKGFPQWLWAYSCTPPGVTFHIQQKTCGTNFYHIVPQILQDHFIIVTPPDLSPLLLKYPYAGLKCRLWLSSAKTLSWVQELQRSNVPEVHVPIYHANLVGVQHAKPGDLIFVEQDAYFICRDIGQLPMVNTSSPGIITMEGRTKKYARVLLFVPREYVQTPN